MQWQYRTLYLHIHGAWKAAPLSCARLIFANGAQGTCTLPVTICPCLAWSTLILLQRSLRAALLTWCTCPCVALWHISQCHWHALHICGGYGLKNLKHQIRKCKFARTKWHAQKDKMACLISWWSVSEWVVKQLKISKCLKRGGICSLFHILLQSYCPSRNPWGTVRTAEWGIAQMTAEWGITRMKAEWGIARMKAEWDCPFSESGASSKPQTRL
jgi:hypothetical protein